MIFVERESKNGFCVQQIYASLQDKLYLNYFLYFFLFICYSPLVYANHYSEEYVTAETERLETQFEQGNFNEKDYLAKIKDLEIEYKGKDSSLGPIFSITILVAISMVMIWRRTSRRNEHKKGRTGGLFRGDQTRYELVDALNAIGVQVK